MKNILSQSEMDHIKYLITKGNPFPHVVIDKILSRLLKSVTIYNPFIKYQDYYNVWENGFNEMNFNELLADIEEGLK